MPIAPSILALGVAAWGVAPVAADADVRTTGAYWDWQLTSPVDYSVDVEVLVMDLTETTNMDIAQLHARGVKTVCYVSVGTAENYRDDYDLFPQSVVGKTYGDWPDERFIDIRARDVIMPIMKARIDACAALGFDAIEPDNMDTWDNDTGFELTSDEQVRYMRELSDYARFKGLEIAQKNAPDFVADYLDRFDFAIVESCFQYDFCDAYQPYLDAGKDVLAAEYPEQGINMSQVCEYAQTSEIKFLFKARELAAGYLTC